MNEENKSLDVDDVEISSLTDEDLDSVAGGSADSCATCVTTGGCCTTSVKPSEE